MPPFAYRLQFLVPKDRLPPTPHDHPHELSRPESAIELHIEQGSGGHPDRLILTSSNIPTARETLRRAESVKRALMKAGLVTSVPMLFGDNTSKTRFSPSVIDRVRAKTGVTIRPEVHGIEIIDQSKGPTNTIRVEAEGRVGTPIETFLDQLTAALEQDHPEFAIDDKLGLALEIFMAAATEHTPRARLLDFVTVLEILADERPRTASGLAVIESALAELDARRTEMDITEADSLRTSLARLRNRSITQSVKDLATGVDADAIDGYHQGDLTQFLGRCYTTRSQLIHDGAAPSEENVSLLAGNLHFVLRYLLLCRIDQTDL